MPPDQQAGAERAALEPERFRVEVRQLECCDSLVLAGAIDPEAVARLHQEAVLLAAGGRPVVFDWSEATRLSAGALQVLLALQASLCQRGFPPRVAGDDPAIRRAFELAGVSARFPLVEGA